MRQFSKGLIFFFILITSILAFIAYSWLMFKSGCTGDLKSGMYGNPEEALKIQAQAAPFFWSTLVAGAISLLFAFNSKQLLRTIVFLWVLLMIPGILISGIYFEGKGLTTCF